MVFFHNGQVALVVDIDESIWLIVKVADTGYGNNLVKLGVQTDTRPTFPDNDDTGY